MAIKLSKEACRRAIDYSREASESLQANANMMDNNVNSQFANLRDPAFQKYLELSGDMQEYLRKISQRMDDVARYCEGVMRWMDEYSEI